MRTDKRQVQTAVLGGADSDEPLMLPMEAIELDAFRHHYGGCTFWCGTLLGGCGSQLTTKLYTDRACHFAHHPHPDGLPHVCGRRARGVNSADHLYVKSATASWLAAQGEQASFEYTRLDGVPIGSVIDVRWQHGALRVHLDQAVPPQWDSDMEPVLGTMVSVDRDTLIDRWYVHRIRLDSEGTTRRVRIGTEAFARPTEWFTLDECEMTERGLTTPAVKHIVRARSTPPPPRWSPGEARKTRKTPEPDARAGSLLRQLAYARRVESAALVKQRCHELEDLAGTSPQVQARLEAAVRNARTWLEEQAEVRRTLFSRLERAVTDGVPGQARKLLLRVNATASEERTETETAIVEKASSYFASLDQSTLEAVEAEADTERAAEEAARYVRTLLKHLRHHDTYTEDLRPQVTGLIRAAARAGDRLTPVQARHVNRWKKRAAQGPQALLHKQVAHRRWIERSCPRCKANQGANCVLADGPAAGQTRTFPHPERLQPIIDERKSRQKEKDRERRERATASRGASSEPRPGKRAPRPATAGKRRVERKEPKRRLHHQVPRGDWYRATCPRCHAGPGKVCANDDRVGPGEKRQLPHDERLQRMLARKAQPQPRQPGRKRHSEEPADVSPARTWHANEVTCPACGATPQTSCTPAGVHDERVKWAEEFTRKLWG